MKWRRINVDGDIYRWRGRLFFICQDANGKRVFGADAHRIKGTTPDVIERGQWKGTSDGYITPQHIADYIRKVKAGEVSPGR